MLSGLNMLRYLALAVVILALGAVGRSERQLGFSPDAPVVLGPVFYLEAIQAEDEWIDHNLPNRKRDRDGYSSSGSGEWSTIGGRRMMLKHPILADGTMRVVYFDWTEVIDERPADVASLFFTARNLWVVSRPDSIQVCALKQDSRDARSKRGYVEGAYEPLSPNEIRRFTKVVLDESSYRWDTSLAMVPEFDTRYRIKRGDQVVYLDICFKFSKLAVFTDRRSYWQPVDIHREAFESIRSSPPTE